jgi:actinorhodin biosynthesis protein ActVIA
MPVDTGPGRLVPPGTYYELRRFYSTQLDARDRGKTQEWLDVFDDDATMTTHVLGHGSPVTKADFTPEVWALDDSFHAKGIQRRHCVSGFTFQARDGLVLARFYGLFLVVDTEGARVQSAAMVSDVLRRFRGTWRVISREIERDDLGRLNGEMPEGLPPGQEGKTVVDRVLNSHNLTVAAEVYSTVDQFYALQMQALDDGDIAGWVETFTDDGVFVSNGLPDEVAGRDQLAKLGRETIDRLNDKGAIRRHFVFNVIIEPSSDGVLCTTCYVPVFDTVDGVTSLTTSTVMRDELIMRDDGLLVRHRTVTRDDLPAKS